MMGYSGDVDCSVIGCSESTLKMRSRSDGKAFYTDFCKARKSTLFSSFLLFLFLSFGLGWVGVGG
jgi:hypothetical protein